MRLLFVSSPIGPLGSGIAGGVELNILNISTEMIKRGHIVHIIGPRGSKYNAIIIDGTYQTMIKGDNDILIEENSVLNNMWNYVRKNQDEYDLIVNFSFDWLSLYLTPFIKCPVGHMISMASINKTIKSIIEQISDKFPKNIVFYTHTQAYTFNIKNYNVIQSGLNLSLYQYCPDPKNELAWIGRISPEKGLEDAIEASILSGIPLKIMGLIQDHDYWTEIIKKYSPKFINYLGYLDTSELQKELRTAKALLMTPKWIEAFGNVAIEALACGVPVISYNRGGLSEIIIDGITGFLTIPDNIDGLVESIKKIDMIDRSKCRKYCEKKYSMSYVGDLLENWFNQIKKCN